MKKYNKVVHLSVQQLTDCSSDSEYGNNGCKGGNVWNAYRYIYENGIIEDSAYQFSSGKTGIQVKLYFNTWHFFFERRIYLHFLTVNIFITENFNFENAI
jgi:hypothetical protein